MATIKEVTEYANELEIKFGAGANIAYANVSNTQLSIARYYGGININGEKFIYNDEDDSLIRDDVCKWIKKRNRDK